MLLLPLGVLAQLESFTTDDGEGLRTVKGKILLQPGKRLVKQLNAEFFVVTENNTAETQTRHPNLKALRQKDLARTMKEGVPGTFLMEGDIQLDTYFVLYSRTGKKWPRPLGYVSEMPDRRILLQDSTGMYLIDGAMKILYKADGLFPLGWPSTYGYVVYTAGKCGLLDKNLKPSLPLAYTGISTYLDYHLTGEANNEYEWEYEGEYDDSEAVETGYRLDNADLVQNHHLLLYNDNTVGLADAHALVLQLEADYYMIKYLDTSFHTLLVFEISANMDDFDYTDAFRLYSSADLSRLQPELLHSISPLLEDYYQVQVEDGKYGILRRSNLEWVQQPEMDGISGRDGYIILKKDKKYALATDELEVLLGYEYDQMYHFELGGADYPLVRVVVDQKEGLYDPNKGEWVLPTIYKNIEDESYRRSSLLRVQLPDGKLGLFQFDKKQFLLKPEWTSVSYNGRDTYLAVSERQMVELNMLTGEMVKRKSVTDQFSYKWKAPVGYLTYRGSMVQADGKVAIGTVSGYRYEEHTVDEADAIQGLSVLDGRTGELLYRLDSLEGDAVQLNGVAMDGNRVYWASETDRAGCTDLATRTQLWTAPMGGEAESSPALADLNGDGAADMIVTLQSRGVVALNGVSGDTLWTAFMDNMSIEACMAAPALIDLNGDQIADVVSPASGLRNVPSWQNNSYEGSVWALDGRTGRTLWQVGMANYNQAKAAPIVYGTGATARIYQPCISGSMMLMSTKGATELIDLPNGACGSWLPIGAEVYGGISYYEEEHHVLAVPTQNGTPYTDDYGRPGLKSKARTLAPGRMPATPLLADVLATGTPQLIMATEDGFLHLLTPQGQLLHTLALPAGTEATPMVADVDQDGLLELLVAAKDGYLYCYDTNSRGTAQWGQHRGDNHNTGCMKNQYR